MKIGLVGSTYDQVSLPFDAQRAINLFAVMDEQGKEVASMYGTPGLILLGNLGGNPIRAAFISANGRAFMVSGSTLFEINSAGVGTARGSLLSTTGVCYIEENTVQIAVCDRQYLYVMDYATNTFQRVVGQRQYITNGDFSSGASWTTGANWSIGSGVAKALNATSNLTQTAQFPLVTGKEYILSYTVTGVSYIQNGDFSSGTGWTVPAGWTIGNGVATCTASSNDLSQTTPELLVAGSDYSVTVTVTRTAGNISMTLGGGAAGTTISASGVYTQILTAGATQIFNVNATSFTGTLDTLSITITPTGDITPSIGGTAGIKRLSSGSYTETIIAGATQDILFAGANFTGKVDTVAVVDKSTGLPLSCGSLTYIDSFFLVNSNGTGRFFKSAPNDGLSWDALDFANAESSPDALLRPIQAVGQLFNMGKYTGEIWTNTGAAAFPFQKVSGGKMNVGILAPATAMELDNTLFWVGRTKEGFGSVYRANGFTPKVISTDPIAKRIKEATDPENIRAWAYEENNHLFYILTGGGLATSLCYDITTQMWHERAYMNSQGEFEQHRGACYMSAFGKHILGDRDTGKIYIMDSKTYDDAGDALIAERVYTHLSDEANRIRYNSLVIGVESGVGLQSGQGSDPLIELQLSTDGARTWSDSYRETIGKVGKYKNKAQFRRLGVTDQMTFKIRISDPVKRCITGSYLS